jgi:hypothetical protein
MDGSTSVDLGVLVEDPNEGAMVRFHVTSCGDDIEVGQLVVIKTTDIGRTISGVDDRHIRAGKSSIRAAVNKGSVVEE